MLAKPHHIFFSTLLVLLSYSFTNAAELAQPVVRDFRYIYPLISPYSNGGDSGDSMYRLSIPFEVYKHSQQLGLKDVRIFDSQGQSMPFCISDVPDIVTDEQQNYPAHQVRIAEQGGEITLLGDQALAQQAQAPTNPATTALPRREATALLFDFEKDQHRLMDVNLVPKAHSLPAGNTQTGSVVSAKLFTSSNMVRWYEQGLRTFGRISAEGQQVELLALNLKTQARYALLVPVEGSTLFAVQGVSARLQSHAQSRYGDYYTQGTWDDEAKGYVYTVPPSLPTRTLFLELPGSTWLINADILTLSPPTGRKQRAKTEKKTDWHFRTTAQFYSLLADKMTQTSKAISFSPTWLRVDQTPNVVVRPTGQALNHPPTLHMAYEKQELSFLAAGPSPFRLAVGTTLTLANSTNAATLKALQRNGSTPLRLGEVQEQAVASTEGSGQTIFIWGALLLGALCMGGIALHMLRTQKNTKES